MKKLCAIALALCLAGALQVVGTANAAEFSYTGYYQVIGSISDNDNDLDNDSPDDVAAFIWHDFTPTFIAKASDDLWGSMKFRIRQGVWGNPGMGEDSAWWGHNAMEYYITRYKSSWYLDTLWMDFRIPTTPARLRLGRFTDNTPKGIVTGGDVHWTGIRLTADLSEVVTANLSFFKRREAPAVSGDMAWSTGIRESEDDMDVWVGSLIANPTPESSVALYVHHQDAGDISNWYYDGSSITWITLSGVYRAGRLSINGDFVWDFGDYNQGECAFGDTMNPPGGPDGGVCNPGAAPGLEGDISGFAVDLRATYDADWATLGVIFAFSTGDDNLTDNDMDGFIGLTPWYTPTNLMFAGRYDWFILRSSGLGANGASVALGWHGQCQFGGMNCDLNDYNGVTLIQANIGKAITPKFNADANLTFLWSSEDGYYPGSPIHEYTDPVTGVVHANTDKMLGTEVDVNATYRVYDQLTWFFESGVLFPGDYYRYVDGDPDDPDVAWELQTGLVYSW